MSSEVRTTSVVILGRDYKIRTNESEEFVREVAAFVDSMMNRISSKMSAGTTSQIAVLAALNIAEELFRERRDDGAGHEAAHNGDAGAVDERLRVMLHRLEEVLEAAPRTTASPPAPIRSAVTS